MTTVAEDYNYSTFTSSEARGKTRAFIDVPHAGDEAPDFELRTPEGEVVTLSQFRDQKHVLLEFGAITWPPFVGAVAPINQLYEQYRDKGFEFLTVYVREPHPGENYHEHHNYEEKVKYACDCREQDGIKTRLVIDDLEGTMHRAYGEMPNMVYVIGKDGRIYYKAMWTNYEEIGSVLEGMAKFDEAAQVGVRRMPFYSERLSFRGGYTSGAGVDVLERAGPKARADFANAIPGPRPGP